MNASIDVAFQLFDHPTEQISKPYQGQNQRGWSNGLFQRGAGMAKMKFKSKLQHSTTSALTTRSLTLGLRGTSSSRSPNPPTTFASMFPQPTQQTDYCGYSEKGMIKLEISCHDSPLIRHLKPFSKSEYVYFLSKTPERHLFLLFTRYISILLSTHPSVIPYASIR